MPIRFIALAASLILVLQPATARAWGDEAHEVIALIANHYLRPAARNRAGNLLGGDASGLTPDRSLATEAVWADRYRDSDLDSDQHHYRQTRAWHFVDLELAGPDLDAACFHHPALPQRLPASGGPAEDCIVDKIDQFRHELSDPATGAAERLLALQFLLHLIGDLHQPLHACDDRDRGGNGKKVTLPGHAAGSLHHYWDSVFVAGLGRDPAAIAQELIAEISPRRLRSWRRGSTADWAMESFEVCKTEIYGKLPPPDGRGEYALDARYAADAAVTVRRQLQRAGVRLAEVLNEALR